MTADLINLNKARKAKARADKQKQAQRNRARFGRPKHEREQAAGERSLADRKLDGAERKPPKADA